MEKGKTDRSSSATLRSARGKGERKQNEHLMKREGGRKRRKERDEMAEAIEAHTGDSRLFDRAPLVRPTPGCSSVDAWHDFF